MKTITFEHNGRLVTIANETQRDLIISELVAEHMKTGLDFEPAWSTVQSKHAILFSGMQHPNVRIPYRQKPVTFSNTGPAPVFGPQLKGIFRLPLDAAEGVCGAAWRANSGTAVPINYRKIFSGLAQWIGQERGLNRDAAEETARVQFPQLWEAVQVSEEASKP